MKTVHLLAEDFVLETDLPLDAEILNFLEEALLLAGEVLQNFAQSPDFAQKMALAFGEHAQLEALQTAWLASDFSILSGIGVRQGTELNGAIGAYGFTTDKIYLSEEFIRSNQGNTEALVNLLLEEVGNRIDAQLNLVDTPGDKGQDFSALVLDKEFTSEQLTLMKAEDDHTFIMPEQHNSNNLLTDRSIRVEAVPDLVTFTGKLEWEDSNGNLHPIRNGWIELYELDRSSTVITGGGTDDNGEYKLTASYSDLAILEPITDPEPEVFLYLRSEPFNYPYTVHDFTRYTTDEAEPSPSSKLSLKINGLPGSYRISSPLKDIYSTGIYSNDPKISVSGKLNKVFSIQDAIYVGHQYGLSVLEEAEDNDPTTEPPPLEVLFPFYSPVFGGRSSFSGDVDRLGPLTDTEKWLKVHALDWMEWDVLLHEFGHYLQDLDDLAVLDIPLSRHLRGESGINKLNKTGIPQTKNEGIQIAWTEGLADYLSLAIQHVVYNKGLLPENMPNVSETGSPDFFITSARADIQSQGFGININLEDRLDPAQKMFLASDPARAEQRFLDISNPKGEGDEASISRILWDLADNNNEAFASGLKDEISIGHVQLYKILDRKIAKGIPGNLESIEDLWNFFLTKPGLGYLIGINDNHKIAKLGAIFQEYNISPIPTSKWLVSEKEWVAENNNPSPTFEWEIGNNDANDEFEVVIFDQNFVEVFRSPLLDSSNLGTEWILSGNIAKWTPASGKTYATGKWEDIVAKPGSYQLIVTGSDTQPDPKYPQGFVSTGPYWSGAYSFNIVPPKDNDSDNVPDQIEQLAGDRNQDGVLDSLQSNVASFRQVNSTSNSPDDFITLASPDGTNLTNVSVSGNPPQSPPQNTDLPIGTLSFGVSNVLVGGTVQVNLLLPAGINSDTYWKYDANQGWYEFLYDGTTGAVFQDTDGDGVNDLITLHFVDGGRGDSDGLADGKITDPGAPGLTQSIPEPLPGKLLVGTDGIDTLIGTPGDDTLIGGGSIDYLSGNGGSDTYVYQAWGDRMDFIYGFKVGIDKIDFTELFNHPSLNITNLEQAIAEGHITIQASGQNGSEIYVDLDGTAGSLRSRPFISLSNVSPVDLNNEINFVFNQGEPASPSGELLVGTDGIDTLIGTKGDDTIIGGGSVDYLIGNGGSDRFVYQSRSDRRDIIYDFEVGIDIIDFMDLFDHPSINLTSLKQAIDEGYITIQTSGQNHSDIYVDLDGTAGPLRSRSMVFVSNVSATDLSNANNFVI
jgi:Ca2+-binding RTX toxin-like protein